MNHSILILLPLPDAMKVSLRAVAPLATFVYETEETVTKEQLEDCEILFCYPSPSLVKRAKNVKLVQLMSAGYNPFLPKDALRDGVKLCCAIGAYGEPVAQHAFATVLSLMKRLPWYHDNQAKKVWESMGNVMDMYGKTYLVAGFGDLGSTFAKLVKPFSSTVIAVVRNPRERELADVTIPLSKMGEYIGQADVVVNCLPEMSETKNIFDKEMLAKMKDQAIFVNVGRGSAMDLEAVCEALKTGKLFGAGLDVFPQEPLPPTHEVWTLPNVLLTPHVSGGLQMPSTLGKVVNILKENIRRYYANEPLHNEVDRENESVKR